MAVTPKNLTSWSASFQDVVSIHELDPNEIGKDPLPIEVQDQWLAAVAALGAMAGWKALGTDTKVNVDISGDASPGHTEMDSITIVVTSTRTSAIPTTEPEPKDVEFGVTQDYPEVPARP